MEGQISITEYSESNTAPIKVQIEYLIEPLPCPFCGCELKDYPKVMTVPPVHSEKYLLAKLNNGRFLGTDNWFHVACPKCGASGSRGIDRVRAITQCNERGHSSLQDKLAWK